MEDFYGETTTGVWSLKIIDDTDGPLPEDGADAAPTRLVTWTLNINESWSGADIYTGNDLIADGTIRTRKGIDVTMGGKIRLQNTEGETTLTIDGQTGQLSGSGGAPFRLSCTRVNNRVQRNTSISCAAGTVMVGLSCNTSTDYRYCSVSQNGNNATCNCNK